MITVQIPDSAWEKAQKALQEAQVAYQPLPAPEWLGALDEAAYELVRGYLLQYYHQKLEEVQKSIAAFESKYQMDFKQFCAHYLMPTAEDLYENELIAMDWEALVQIKNEIHLKIDTLQHERHHQSLPVYH